MNEVFKEKFKTVFGWVEYKLLSSSELISRAPSENGGVIITTDRATFQFYVFDVSNEISQKEFQVEKLFGVVMDDVSVFGVEEEIMIMWRLLDEGEESRKLELDYATGEHLDAISIWEEGKNQVLHLGTWDEEMMIKQGGFIDNFVNPSVLDSYSLSTKIKLSQNQEGFYLHHLGSISSKKIEDGLRGWFAVDQSKDFLNHFNLR